MKISQFFQTPTLLTTCWKLDCRASAAVGSKHLMPGEANFDFLHTAARDNIPHEDPLSSTTSAWLRASRSVTEGDMV